MPKLVDQFDHYTEMGAIYRMIERSDARSVAFGRSKRIPQTAKQPIEIAAVFLGQQRLITLFSKSNSVSNQ